MLLEPSMDISIENVEKCKKQWNILLACHHSHIFSINLGWRNFSLKNMYFFYIKCNMHYSLDLQGLCTFRYCKFFLSIVSNRVLQTHA